MIIWLFRYSYYLSDAKLHCVGWRCFIWKIDLHFAHYAIFLIIYSMKINIWMIWDRSELKTVLLLMVYDGRSTIGSQRWVKKRVKEQQEQLEKQYDDTSHNIIHTVMGSQCWRLSLKPTRSTRRMITRAETIRRFLFQLSCMIYFKNHQETEWKKKKRGREGNVRQYIVTVKERNQES